MLIICQHLSTSSPSTFFGYSTIHGSETSRRPKISRLPDSETPLGNMMSHTGEKLSTVQASCSIALYYISLLSGLGNIDDQNRNPNVNNRDHLVRQWTPGTPGRASN